MLRPGCRTRSGEAAGPATDVEDPPQLGVDESEEDDDAEAMIQEKTTAGPARTVAVRARTAIQNR